MSTFRLPRNVLGKVVVMFFWWPLAVPLWLMWFVFIGWWWLLLTEPYAHVNVKREGALSRNSGARRGPKLTRRLARPEAPRRAARS